MRLASTLLAVMLGILTLPGCSLMPFDWFSSNADSVAADTADPRVRYAEGRAHLAADRLGLALSAFQRAHFESPADSQIVNALGVTYDRLRRFDLAQKYYRQALLLDGGSASTLNNLGYSLLLAGELKRAAETLAQAFERGEKTPEAATIRANIALLKKRIGPANVAERNAPAAADAAARKIRLVPTGSNSHDLQTGQTRIANAIVATQPRFLPAPRKPKLAVSKPVVVAASTESVQTPVAKALITPPADFLPAPRKPTLAVSKPVVVAASTESVQTRIAKALVTPPADFVPAPRKPKADVIVSASSIELEPDTDVGRIWVAKPLVEPLVRPQTPPRKPKFGSTRTNAPETGTAAGRTLIVEAPAAPRLRLVPTAVDPQVAATTAMALEVSNGTERPHLALRVSEYFAGHGYKTVLRTKALSLDHSTSVIFYRTGEEDKARAIAALLPFIVEMYPVPDLVAEVKVLLGSDSLSFDETLTASANTHHSRGKDQT